MQTCIALRRRGATLASINRLNQLAAPVMIKLSHGAIQHSEHFVGLHLKLV